MNPWLKDVMFLVLYVFLILVIFLSVVGFAGFLATCFQILIQ